MVTTFFRSSLGPGVAGTAIFVGGGDCTGGTDRDFHMDVMSRTLLEELSSKRDT